MGKTEILRTRKGGQADSYHLSDPTEKLNITLPTCLFSSSSKTTAGSCSALLLKALILQFKN